MSCFELTLIFKKKTKSPAINLEINEYYNENVCFRTIITFCYRKIRMNLRRIVDEVSGWSKKGR